MYNFEPVNQISKHVGLLDGCIDDASRLLQYLNFRILDNTRFQG
ncbi:hypothetical protein FWK35_00004708 [Aphis craccivora]|uniref:Uncharacterized protein n=1 Tax=Aphis craccivora TaxID=307492 RepID=A0A6G0ZRK0_APHCR|nr:hypothetical protein FWK35_00004708 [Aphis craccivora]